MIGFPLLLIPLAVYNIIAFLMHDVAFDAPLIKLVLMSGAEWQVTLSDILLALGILMLLFEVIKGVRPGAKYLTDHLLSLIVFGAAAAEFVLWPKFGNSTYFLLTALALVDFLSGIVLRARRGTGATSTAAVSKKTKNDLPTADSHFEPVQAPAPVRPAAASVAESVLLDHPEPTLAQPAVPSPGLQPGGNPSPDTPQR